MLKLISGKAKTGKTDMIIEEIKHRVRQSQKRVLLIVPEQFSHEAERELCRECGDSLSMTAEVISFTRLYRRVMDMVGGDRAFMDKGGRVLALGRALTDVSSRLHVYKTAHRSPELQALLLQIIAELKTASITPEMLSAEAQRDDDALHEKLRDISLILSAYDAVASRGKFDPSDRLNFLVENIKKLKAESFSAVYIDGFIDFTAQEREIIAALTEKSADMTIALTMGGMYEENEVFEHSRKTALWFAKLAEQKRQTFEHVELEEMSENTATEVFRKYLFGFTSKTYNGAEIGLYRSASIAHECELAAAKCRELVQNGCRYRDIVIAMRDYETYRATMECVFERYEVPMYAAVRSDVMKKPLPLLVSSAISAVNTGFSYDDMFTYLKTGLSELDFKEIDLLENYCITWDISGKAWQKDFEMHPDGYNREDTEESISKLAEINSLREKVITPLLKLKTSTDDAKTITELTQCVSRFFVDINLPQTLQKHAERLEHSGQKQRATEYEQLWGVVVNSLEQMHGVLGDMELSFTEFASLYQLMLAQCKVGSIPVSLDRVTVGNIERVRHRNVKHLILLGASDQNMPRIDEGGQAFSSEEKKQLSELGFEIGSTIEDVLSREMNAIYNCIALPDCTMSISYCPQSQDNSVALPSFVMTRAAALFDVQIIDADIETCRTFASRPMLELAVSSVNDGSELATSAFEYCQMYRHEDKIENAIKLAKLSRSSLSKQSVTALYGKEIRLSASRTDKFNSCRFAYFLQYGLKAKPRQKAGFNPPEMGTFVHFILENVAKELKNSGGFTKAERKEVDKLCNKYTRIYISEELNDFRDKTKRFNYLFTRLCKSVREIVWDMVEELSKSKFEPLDFELQFTSGSGLSVKVGDCEDNSAELIGTVDRVDGWLNDGKLYLRVVDYKTGKKSFSLSDVWHGMNMQMLMYLFALEKQGEARYGKEIASAGVLYFPARDDIIRADVEISDSQIIAEKMKAKKRSGLLLNEIDVIKAMESSEEPAYLPIKYKDSVPTGEALASAEQLGKLSQHIEETLAKLSAELRSGSILADPYYRSAQENACLYCDYFDACYFSEGEDCRRKLTKLRPADVWRKLEEEDEVDGI